MFLIPLVSSVFYHAANIESLILCLLYKSDMYMRIDEVKPDPDLKLFITRYLEIEASKEELPEAKVLPTGYSYLIYASSEPCLAKIEGTERELPRLVIVGQVSASDIRLVPPNTMAHEAVEFHPGSLYFLYGIDMSCVTNNIIDFQEVTGDQTETKHLLEIFQAQVGFKPKCRVLDEYFKNKMRGKGPRPQIFKAVEIVLKNNGMVGVGALADEVGISERQLRRQFQKVCGISPQKYAKIIQVRSVFKHIRKGETYRLQDLAYDCDCFDVSHFIKTFKNVIGENPRKFLESEDVFIQRYIRGA